MKNLSIIVPVWNEENTIVELIKRINDACKEAGITYEIIVIDDNSTDRTLELLKPLNKEFPISIHTKEGQKGKAQSLLEGFKHARFDHVGMIDADLQYPPEYIPYMYDKLSSNIDIVVAYRKHQKRSLVRRFVGGIFRVVFVKLLHNMDVDAQSGLKIFKKEIIERLDIKPDAWAFDLEFLLRAKDAGYHIVSVEITFEGRKDSKSKINVLSASFQIGFSALKLYFRKHFIIPFHQNQVEKHGQGFTFKGADFVHHSTLSHHESAFHQLNVNQKYIISFALLAFIIVLFIDWHLAIIVFVAVLTVIYFIGLFFDFYLIQKGYRIQPEIQITDEQLRVNTKKIWPKYTILCPLYKEWQVLPQFVTAMTKVDYPKDKLQVLLLLEEDDRDTIEHIQEYAHKLPKYFEIVIVPDSLPKTKPKACNYGLKRADGEFVVIYDAEDVPEPKQLKKAILAFEMVDKKVVCLQAKLNFYNPRHNILTRIFTAEYSLWFDLVLTGMQSIETPIPLGGTSNHFRVKDLRNLHAWDAFNVTEDADLGIRLSKKGYRTAILDSITLEEANSHFLNWIHQRTRWIKGYLQTYFVHTRNLSQFETSTRKHQRYTFQLVIGTKILSTLINPLMWATTITYFAFRPVAGKLIESFFPTPVFYMGVFCLVFGNFLYLYYYMIGCAKRNHYDLIKYAYFVPFYWLTMSYAGWLAVVSLIRQPHYWHKTIHGLHLKSDKATQQSAFHIGRDLVDKKLLGR